MSRTKLHGAALFQPPAFPVTSGNVCLKIEREGTLQGIAAELLCHSGQTEHDTGREFRFTTAVIFVPNGPKNCNGTEVGGGEFRGKIYSLTPSGFTSESVNISS